ncbi:MAG: nucleotide exchange factor GrpE [Clostridia bacterium]|nr:nucleotide exchange factor GrpE [Clostridia bacterium]
MKEIKPIEEKINETVEEVTETAPETAEAAPDGGEMKKKSREVKKLEAEIEDLKKELDAKTAALAEENDKYVRMLAEYDNYRRRTAKEREMLYADAVADTVTEMLTVLDNLERAAQYNDAESVGQGVKMTLKGMTDALAKLGITEVETETFDPNIHNAVMHVEDETRGEGEIVEVLQKGYRRGDKIIRYPMVKVAN